MRRTKQLIAALAVSLGMIGLTAIPALAWGTSQTATAYCDTATGQVMLKATFTNTESNTTSNRMHVAASKGLGTQDVSGGSTANFGPVSLGAAPQAAGSVTFALSWTDGHSGTDSRTASYGAVSACSVPVVKNPRASIAPGTCSNRVTTVSLDNSGSNAAVTFDVNGASYTLAAGATQAISLGAFTGTVTVKYGNTVLATSSVSYSNCTVSRPAASIVTGTCGNRSTVATLDNSASNVAVTFLVNGTAYSVGAGSTQSVSLGSFEGTVTVSSGGTTLAQATVSYTSCTVLRPAATIQTGTCASRVTTATLDNTQSNVSATFTVNGTAYTVGAGNTQSVNLGSFEGTVTVSSGGAVLAQASVSYASCTQDFGWRVKKQMMHGEGPRFYSGVVNAAPGTAVTVTITRAPTYLTVTIEVAGKGVVFTRTMSATPGRTTVRVDIGTVSVEKYARLAGRPTQTAVFHGTLA